MKQHKSTRKPVYLIQIAISFSLLLLALLTATANSMAEESKERLLQKSMKPSRAYSLIMRQPDFSAFKEMGYNKESKSYIFRYPTKDGTEKIEYLPADDPSEKDVSEK